MCIYIAESRYYIVQIKKSCSLIEMHFSKRERIVHTSAKRHLLVE